MNKLYVCWVQKWNAWSKKPSRPFKFLLFQVGGHRQMTGLIEEAILRLILLLPGAIDPPLEKKMSLKVSLDYKG